MTAMNTALTGLTAYSRVNEVSGNNLANISTPGFIPTRATVTESVDSSGVVVTLSKEAMSRMRGTDLVNEFATQNAATQAYRANMSTVRAAAEMDKSLTDALGDGR
jgi:flagellar basal body rod protein FlgG